MRLSLDLDDKELKTLRNKHGDSFKEIVEGTSKDIGEWFFDEYLEWLRAERTNEGAE